MRYSLPLVWLLAGPVMAADTDDARDARPCAECHPAIAESFAETRMARAATGQVFLQDWHDQDFPPGCMDCHAPSGGPGLVCSDCHGPGPHPYPALRVPEVCGRCHDAPGESTLRRFRESPASRKGEHCLDCHLTDDAAAGHRFEGPSSPGFLEGVARVRLSLRADVDGPVAVARVSHRAGHALPGGTTGRSVWLVVSGLDGEGTPVWGEEVRFGWEHPRGQPWQDRTLPPGRLVVLELSLRGRGESERLRAQLWYRFAAGPLSEADPRQVLLDQSELVLPRGVADRSR